MANLVSPGVSVTVTDESFFIPAAASTVPLFFIATADEKFRANGVTPAAGTFENNVIRTVTSLKQSTELYGIPRFLQDSAGNPHHGDVRNEYGLLAMNQFLGVGNMCYAIRANVNLNDTLVNLLAMFDTKMQESAYILENLVVAFLQEYNTSGSFTPNQVNQIGTLGTVVPGSLYTNGVYTNVSLTGGSGIGAKATITVAGAIVTTVVITTPGTGYDVADSLTAAALSIGGTGTGFSVPVATITGFKNTVHRTTLLSLTSTATDPVWATFSFKNSKTSFTADVTSAPLQVFANGYAAPATGTYPGYAGLALAWESGALGGTVGKEFTPIEASNLLLSADDSFKYTSQFYNQTSLGSNNATRRAAIVTALNAAIVSNADIRSEAYEYNLILCPGFHEVDVNLLSLSLDIGEEAFVIGETPFDKDPEAVVTWAATIARQSSRNIAYYYPHGLASNLDGSTVFCASSGIALRTITYSDNASELWFAPAGSRRGLVSGVSNVGYVSGALGSATTFKEVALSRGQRDNLYKYFTNINPIVFFPGRGLVVYGQKTSAPDASALDRINVERLIIYVKRQLRKSTMPFVFEPNDQLTRDNLKAMVDSFLGDLLVKRGLYDFATVCDTSNNTPDRVDRNELYIDVALKPVRAAEFIYIPIRVLATGAEL